MTQGLKVTTNEGVLWLQGAIDEAAGFERLLACRDSPLRLNLRGVTAINSLGLRKMINFAKELGQREVEFLDCPPVFIEAVNVMPLVIGGQARIDRIKSLYLPFHCADDHERSFSVPLKAIVVQGTLMMPLVECPVCRMPMEPELDSEPDEFFFFLTA